MKQIFTTLISNDCLGSGYNRITLRCNGFNEKPSSGQFVSIRISDSTSPLLRRPFAISEYDPQSGTVEFIYTKRGPATEILAGMSPGDSLDVILPLGNTLQYPEEGRTALIIAGGTGLGPMLFWARTLSGKKMPYKLVFGCRTADMVPTALFDGLDHVICTDDGTAGFKGTTIGFLKTLSNDEINKSTIYACGPHPMLKACHLTAEEHKVQCWVSLEQTMACGVGACMGCVVKVKGEKKFARVCKEGPVFDSKEIIWD